MVGLNALARHLQPQAIKARERGQVRAIKGSIGHVEVFQMDGVGTPIIGRPRPLPSHDTPNPAHNTYTLKCEEPLYLASYCVPVRDVGGEVGFEALEGLPVLAAKKLVLDVTEDLLSCAVVDAVAFA